MTIIPYTAIKFGILLPFVKIMDVYATRVARSSHNSHFKQMPWPELGGIVKILRYRVLLLGEKLRQSLGA